MNSSFYVSGLIALTLYLLSAGLVLGYFHFQSHTPAVGAQDTITIDLKTLTVPKAKEEQESGQKKQQIAPKQPKNDSAPKAAPKRSLNELFSKVGNEPAQTAKPAPQYKSSYQKQRFDQRKPAAVNIDSIKNVTITQQSQGDVKDEAVMAFQRFVARLWNPDVTSAHSAKIAVTVQQSGDLVYRVIHYSNSKEFNREIDDFINSVAHYEPVEQTMRIELVLKTKK